MNPQANKFDEKIKGIKNSFFSALDDFKKYYVFYNKNPEVDEYQNFFATSKGHLQGLNSDIFVVTNSIQKNIKDLNIREEQHKKLENTDISIDIINKF